MKSRTSKSNGYNTTGVTRKNDSRVRRVLAKLRRFGVVVYRFDSPIDSTRLKLWDIANNSGLVVTENLGDDEMIIMDDAGRKRYTFGS